jgi:hypothetical protein
MTYEINRPVLFVSTKSLHHKAFQQLVGKIVDARHRLAELDGRIVGERHNACGIQTLWDGTFQPTCPSWFILPCGVLMAVETVDRDAVDSFG